MQLIYNQKSKPVVHFSSVYLKLIQVLFKTVTTF